MYEYALKLDKVCKDASLIASLIAANSGHLTCGVHSLPVHSCVCVLTVDNTGDTMSLAAGYPRCLMRFLLLCKVSTQI